MGDWPPPPSPASAVLVSSPTLNQGLLWNGSAWVSAGTQPAGDNSVKPATTAYVDRAVGTEASRAGTAEGLLIPLSERGAVNGVATLDGSGMVPRAQLPSSSSGVNVKDPAYGAKGDGKVVNDGAITSGQATLSSVAAAFTAADANKLVSVENGADLTTTGNTHSTNVIDGLAGVTLNGVVFSAAQGVKVGAPVAGPGVPGGATVTAILGPQSVQISAPTTTSVVGAALTFGTSLVTTISSVAGGVATLAASATRTLSAAKVTYGSDDRAAIQAAITAANGGKVEYPDGLYLANVYPGAVATPLTIVDGTTFVGSSRNSATVRFWPDVSPIVSGGAGYLTFIRLTGTQSITLRNITIQGPDAYAGSGSFNAGITHTGTGGEIRLINSTIKRFVNQIRKDASASDTVSIEAITSRIEGCGGNPGSDGVLATSTGTGNYGGKRVRLDNCKVTNFGWIGSNQYHGLYVYSDHDVDTSGTIFTNQFGTGLCCQVFDSTVALANAAQVCNFSGVTIAGSCPGGGIVTNYNCQTIIEDTWFLGGNNSLLVAGPLKCFGSEFTGTGSSNYQVQTIAPGQNTGLALVMEFFGCLFQGSAFSYIDIFQQGTNSDETIVSNCRFIGATNDSCIFQETHSAAGTNTSRVVVRNSTFEGTNLCVHSHGGTGTNTTIVELSGNDFLTTGALNRALTLSVNPASRVSLLANNFSTGDATPVALNSAASIVDSRANYGTSWNERTAVADANYTATQLDELVAFTSITAARTVTLPAAASVPVGKRLILKDESGSASATNKINASGTIDGAAQAVATAYGTLRLYANGSSWHVW